MAMMFWCIKCAAGVAQGTGFITFKFKFAVMWIMAIAARDARVMNYFAQMNPKHSFHPILVRLFGKVGA